MVFLWRRHYNWSKLWWKWESASLNVCGESWFGGGSGRPTPPNLSKDYLPSLAKANTATHEACCALFHPIALPRISGTSHGNTQPEIESCLQELFAFFVADSWRNLYSKQASSFLAPLIATHYIHYILPGTGGKRSCKEMLPHSFIFSQKVDA